MSLFSPATFAGPLLAVEAESLDQPVMGGTAYREYRGPYQSERSQGPLGDTRSGSATDLPDRQIRGQLCPASPQYSVSRARAVESKVSRNGRSRLSLPQPR